MDYPICNPGSGSCNKCSGDFDCPDVNNAKCTSSGACGPCDDDEQCHPSTTKSQCSSGTCVDCTDDQWCNDNIDEGLLCKSGKCSGCDSMTECINSPDYGTGYSCIFNSGVGNICSNS